MSDLHAQAALFLLGQLSPEEAAAFERESAQNADYRSALAEMTETIAAAGMGMLPPRPVAPPASVKQRLLERLESNPYPGLFARRAHEQGPWKPSKTPGISYKKLYHDKDSGLVTMLVKLEPGARFGSHSHAKTEQCLILEGDLRYSEDKIYRAGDFTWAEGGSVDPALYSVEGATLLIIGQP